MAAGKTALVLGGGGTLGAVETGFIRRLTELGIPVDFVVGTSVGAINAAYVALHDDPSHDCFRDIWAGLRSERLYSRNPLRVARSLFGARMSVYDNSFVRSLIGAHLHEDDFSAARIPLYITAANLCTGQRHIFSDGSLLTAILASSAIPGLFPPVRIGDDLYADGGVVGSLDIGAAVDLGAKTVIAIDLRPPLTRRCPANIVDVLTRSLQLLADSRAACSTEHMGYGETRVVHIQPGLTTDDRSGFRDVERLLAESYTMACQVFDKCWDGRVLLPGHYHPEGPG
jgi:NTE family protein